MNLRGTVIPIIDLAYKLGLPSAAANERSAIVVTEVKNMAIQGKGESLAKIGSILGILAIVLFLVQVARAPASRSA